MFALKINDYQKTKQMETAEKTVITVETTVHASKEKLWEYWTKPEHIKNWNHASDDWHSPRVENDVRKGGSFVVRMEAKDGSFGFDFGGVYDEVTPGEYLAYTIGDGRKVTVSFSAAGNETHVTESFEAESQNPIEMQRGGWQAILDNFKNYTENN
jgi:uncharacterized protein YndB with AHSA1/START domain